MYLSGDQRISRPQSYRFLYLFSLLFNINVDVHLMLRVCLLVNAADYDFEDVLLAPIDESA